MDTNYFEIEIVDKGARSPGISIGLAGRRHPLEARLGEFSHYMHYTSKEVGLVTAN